jgi:hypothetical protein
MPRKKLRTPDVDVEYNSNPFQRCFGRFFGKNGKIKQDQPCVVATPAINKKFNAETEGRIREWILNSSLCYCPLKELSCQNEDLSSKDENIAEVCEGFLGFECSDFDLTARRQDLPFSAAKVAPTIVNNKTRNKSRWKGKLLFDSPGIHALLSGQEKKIQPESNNSPPSAQDCPPTHSSAASARRIIRMRQPVVLQTRRSPAQIEAQPQPQAGPVN